MSLAKKQVQELTVEEIYQKKDQKEHVLDEPDTYIGSVEVHEDYQWVIDENFGTQNNLDNSSLGSLSEILSSNGDEVSNEPLAEQEPEQEKGETRMVMKKIKYVPGLYKIYDEVLVNAIDHWTRMNEKIRQQKLIREGKMEETPEITLSMKFKPVKNIWVEIDQVNNRISVTNDGDGIPVDWHKTCQVYVPELIFSQFLLLTF